MAEGQNPPFLSDTRMCRLNRSEPFTRNPFFSMTAWATRRRYEQQTGDLRLLMPTHLLSAANGHAHKTLPHCVLTAPKRPGAGEITSFNP